MARMGPTRCEHLLSEKALTVTDGARSRDPRLPSSTGFAGLSAIRRRRNSSHPAVLLIHEQLEHSHDIPPRQVLPRRGDEKMTLEDTAMMAHVTWAGWSRVSRNGWTLATVLAATTVDAFGVNSSVK